MEQDYKTQRFNNTNFSDIDTSTVYYFMFASGGAMGSPGEVRLISLVDNSIVLFRSNHCIRNGITLDRVFTSLGIPKDRNEHLEHDEWRETSLGMGNSLYIRTDMYVSFMEKIKGKHPYQAFMDAAIETLKELLNQYQREKETMNVIGFDFGTTNSTISFYNTETKTLDCFQLNASSTDYIPTVVAYKGDEVCIGDIAKKNLTKKGYESYEHFKLRLGSAADTVIDGKTKTPIEVTADYIKELLEEYRHEQNIENIDGIVMTVPETWFREASNRTARENIEKIYEKLGYDIDTQFQLESEPVAAAGYFSWTYEHSAEKNPKKEKYNGFITVIDYGGGTLDVTLCRVENGGNIKILERCGYGEYNVTNGCAGVAFDEAVVEKICKDNDIELPHSDRKFIKLRDTFEKEKISETKHITDMMQAYYKDPGIVEDEVLLTLEYEDDELPVYCADLAECFEKINKPVLDESLAQMKSYYKAHSVDESDQKQFKVLLVGGFSNFYCVEETVRNFFGSRTGLADTRFDQVFSVNNKSLAIAKGAALIAQKVVKVDHTCTHNIGYIAVRPDDQDRWIDTDITIIKKGTKISEVKEPIYAPGKVQVRLKSGVLRIFLDDGRENGKGRTQAALDQSVGEIFPNMDDTDNEYQIGFSVDKNLIPTLHIKDRKNTVKQVRLNSLLSRIAVREKQDKE